MLRTGSFGRRLALLAVGGLLLFATAGSSADTFAVHLVSQDNNSITLGWSPQPGYGYLFSADGQLRSRTNDPNRASVKFSKQYSTFDIDVITKGANGHYPETAPPPPTAGTVKQTIVNGSTIPNINDWRAVYDANGDGSEDDPGQMQFIIDGAVVLTEVNVPFGDTFADGSITTGNGSHQFQARALTDNGVLVATSTVTATVNSTIPPPPPPPPPTGSFPNATNTGVPAGTNLTAYTGPTTITTANTVIDSKNISGCLDINTTGVVIRNSLIHANCDWLIDVTGGTGTSVTVQDTEIDCQDSTVGGNGIVGDDVVAVRVNIRRCENGGSVDGRWDIRDSYIHDFYMNNPTTHSDGLQTFGNVSNVTVVHNTILAIDENNPGAQTATAAIIADEPGHMNWLITNNKFGGAGFTIYCGTPPTTFVIRDNAFTNLPVPPAYGYSRGCGAAGVTQSGNYVLETGQPLTLG